MITKSVLELKTAKQIASICEAAALENKWRLSIAIVNDAGILQFLFRMDDSTNASVDISIAKAKHAAYYKRDTKFHEDLLKNGNQLVLSLSNVLPIEGGVQLIYMGELVGAIGVSGAASHDDGVIARLAADYCLSL